jgi:hypothetical protein
MSARTSVSRRTALFGAGTLALAACSGGAGSMITPTRATSASRRMTMQIVSNAGARARKLSSMVASTTTAAPDGGTVNVSDGLFTGYDGSGNFFAQIDTSTEDQNGMPIMKVVTANGTSATVNFPDLSTISPGAPWAFSFQGNDYSLLLSPDSAGNVQLRGPGGASASIANVGGDRVVTDQNGKQFTMPGAEIDRIGNTLFATPTTSAPAPTSATRTTRQAVAQPVGGGPGPGPFPAPGAPGPCTPQQITNCENLRDAIFALFVLALIAIALLGIGCLIGAWFLAGICTIGVAVALTLATAMMLRSVRLFNFGVCGRTCHIYA